MCLAESEKTYFPTIGKMYNIVPQECSILEPLKQDNFKVIKGKTHGTVQQALSVEDETYVVLKKFILDNLGHLVKKE